MRRKLVDVDFVEFVWIVNRHNLDLTVGVSNFLKYLLVSLLLRDRDSLLVLLRLVVLDQGLRSLLEVLLLKLRLLGVLRLLLLLLLLEGRLLLLVLRVLLRLHWHLGWHLGRHLGWVGVGLLLGHCPVLELTGQSWLLGLHLWLDELLKNLRLILLQLRLVLVIANDHIESLDGINSPDFFDQ